MPSYYSPLPPLYEDLFALPGDPLRAANLYGRQRAGYSLLASAGSPRYAEALAQAFAAYDQGRQGEMERYQEIANRRRIMEAQMATLDRQAQAEERRAEAEERQGRALQIRLDEEAREAESRESERQYWLSLLPEEERPKYALAPTRAIEAAATAKKPEPIRMDLGDREVLIDPETFEEVASFRQGRVAGAADPEDPEIRQGPDGRYYELDPVTRRWKPMEGMAAKKNEATGRLTASQWLDVLRAERPTASDMDLAAEAEARAVGTYVAPPSRESALAVSGRARQDLAAGRFGGGISGLGTPAPPPVTSPETAENPEVAAVRAALAAADEATVRARLSRKGVPPERIEELIRQARGGG